MSIYDAIETLRLARFKLDADDGGITHRTIAFDMAIKALEQMEKDRWIPVTERLPKLNEPVLFCNDYGSVFVSAITWMSEDGNAWCIGKRHRKARVIAWMPRPKPYKEGTR